MVRTDLSWRNDWGRAPGLVLAPLALPFVPFAAVEVKVCDDQEVGSRSILELCKYCAYFLRQHTTPDDVFCGLFTSSLVMARPLA